MMYRYLFARFYDRFTEPVEEAVLGERRAALLGQLKGDDGVLLAQIVRVPPSGIDSFRRFEALVLPLLAEHRGRLERRLRSLDGGIELHVAWFPSHEALQCYVANPRRQANVHLLHESRATSELLHVIDVTDEV